MRECAGGLDQVLGSLDPSEVWTRLSCLTSVVVKPTDRGYVGIGDVG